MEKMMILYQVVPYQVVLYRVVRHIVKKVVIVLMKVEVKKLTMEHIILIRNGNLHQKCQKMKLFQKKWIYYIDMED